MILSFRIQDPGVVETRRRARTGAAGPLNVSPPYIRRVFYKMMKDVSCEFD